MGAVHVELVEVAETDGDFLLVPLDGRLDLLVGSDEVGVAGLNELASAATLTVEGSLVGLLEELSRLFDGVGDDALDALHGVLPFRGDVLSGLLLDESSAFLTGFTNLGELSGLLLVA